MSKNALTELILLKKYEKGIRKGELYRDCERLNINAYDMYRRIINHQIDKYGHEIIKKSRHIEMAKKEVNI